MHGAFGPLAGGQRDGGGTFAKRTDPSVTVIHLAFRKDHERRTAILEHIDGLPEGPQIGRLPIDAETTVPAQDLAPEERLVGEYLPGRHHVEGRSYCIRRRVDGIGIRMRRVIGGDEDRLLIGQQLADRFRPLHIDLQEPFVALLFAEAYAPEPFHKRGVELRRPPTSGQLHTISVHAEQTPVQGSPPDDVRSVWPDRRTSPAPDAIPPHRETRNPTTIPGAIAC